MKENLQLLLTESEIEIIPLNFFNAKAINNNPTQNAIESLLPMQNITCSQVGDYELNTWHFYKLICK